MSNLLALLKRLSNRCDDDTLRAELQTFSCPECCMQQPGHESFCELKAQIDRLEAEEAQLPKIKFLPGRMRCRHSKIPRFEGPAIDVCDKCSVSFDVSGMEPPTSERNEGHS